MTTHTRPVRVGVQIAPQYGTYESIRERVLRLEDMGVDIIFNWDHFFPLTPPQGGGAADGPHFESWTMLAAIAEQTERVEFGPLVNCNSYRNPDLQADMARTIDHISAKGGVGRFVFGTGSGWFERDYLEYGYEFGTAGTRLDALARDLPRIRERWTKLDPAPTRDIPILIGGGGEKKTLRIVAEHADIWHSFPTPEVLASKLEVLQGHCDAVGRDIREIEISVENRGGDLETVHQLHAIGATLITVGLTYPDTSLEPVEKMLAWRDSVNAG
jgi:probable F420-dependent oxidoreductase